MRTVRGSGEPQDRDRGAVLVWVALMMTVLLGVGALTIDLGALYAEKRQLQNGADAAALAVAQSCAGGSCSGYSAQAQQYADLNAQDGASAVDVVCGVGLGLPACSGSPSPGVTGATGWVKVTTSTKTSGGGTQVQFVLAPIMNSLAGATVHASAVAAWGALGGAVTSPLTFSACEFLALGGSLSDGTFPTGTRYIYFHAIGATSTLGTANCRPSTSGADLPGGFGWVAGSSTCTVTLTADATVTADPGNGVPSGCDLSTWNNQEILISVYDIATGSGSNGQYHLIGFVGFKVLGYRFPGGGNKWPSNFSCPLGPGNSSVCIQGQFTRVVTDGSLGGTVNLGAQVIKMVG